VSVEHQVAILYAVIHDYLKDVQVEFIPDYEQGLYDRLDGQNESLMRAIRETGDLSKDSEAELAAAIQAYTEDFLKLHEEA
jgi:F-type H+-transporting ATPase subunit alpha